MFDENRYTFDEDMREKQFLHLRSYSGLDLWPLDFKFAPQVTFLRGYLSAESEVSTAFMVQEN